MIDKYAQVFIKGKVQTFFSFEEFVLPNKIKIHYAR